MHHTCNALVEVTRILLNTVHRYVCMGKFCTDPLEKADGKFRQGCGGTYFITVRSVIEKHRIQVTKLVLELELKPCDSSPDHECPSCTFWMSESQLQTFHCLEDLEPSVHKTTMMTLVYISGYVCRHVDDEEIDTYKYYEQHGEYLVELNRGKLRIPNDRICQWTFFSYILFYVVSSEVCWKSLKKLLYHVSEFYSLGVTEAQASILTNIF